MHCTISSNETGNQEGVIPMGIGDMIGFAFIASVFYGINWVFFYSKTFGNEQSMTWPSWLKFLAVAFTPVTFAIEFALACFVLVLIMGALLRAVFTGEAWRDFKKSQAENKAAMERIYERQLQVRQWRKEQQAAEDAFNREVHEMIDARHKGNPGGDV